MELENAMRKLNRTSKFAELKINLSETNVTFKEYVEQRRAFGRNSNHLKQNMLLKVKKNNVVTNKTD